MTAVVSFVWVCVLQSPRDTDNNLFTFFDPSTWERLCCAVHLSSNTLYACLHSQILILSLCIFTVLTLQYHLSPHQHHLEVENKSHNSGTYTQTAFRRNLISHLVPECAGNRVITVESFLTQKVSSIQKPLFSSYVLMITCSDLQWRDYPRNLKMHSTVLCTKGKNRTAKKQKWIHSCLKYEVKEILIHDFVTYSNCPISSSYVSINIIIHQCCDFSSQ